MQKVVCIPPESIKKTSAGCGRRLVPDVEGTKVAANCSSNLSVGRHDMVCAFSNEWFVTTTVQYYNTVVVEHPISAMVRSMVNGDFDSLLQNHIQGMPGDLLAEG
jgi:hypothetical protein